MQALSLPVNRPRPTANIALIEVSRAHGLRELKLKDEVTLRLYASFLNERIAAHEHTLKSNIRKEFAAQIREDIRYFQTIQDEITTILTAFHHAK